MSPLGPKDKNLIKGAMRRAFARSELRNSVLEAAIVPHSDPKRPKVKKWVRCAVCSIPEAKSYCAVDHIVPVVPLDTTFQDMSLDDAAERMWCDRSNLQAICPRCHKVKTKAENALRPKKPRKKKIK